MSAHTLPAHRSRSGRARTYPDPQSDGDTEVIPATRLALQRLLVSVEDMAWMLSIGRPKAWELVMSGAVFSLTIGKKSRRVPVAAIETYVREQVAAQSTTQQQRGM